MFGGSVIISQSQRNVFRFSSFTFFIPKIETQTIQPIQHTCKYGSVTITQSIAITGGYDMAGTPVNIAAQTSDTTSVVLAGGTATSTFLADKTFKITGEAAYGDSKDTQFSINGTEEVGVTGTELAAAGFAKTAKGAAEYFATQLAAKTDLNGVSFRVGRSSWVSVA